MVLGGGGGGGEGRGGGGAGEGMGAGHRAESGRRLHCAVCDKRN